MELTSVTYYYDLLLPTLIYSTKINRRRLLLKQFIC